MKYITNQTDFYIETQKFKKNFIEGMSLPNNVFSKQFTYFMASEFEAILIDEFFDGLKVYMKTVQESNYTFYIVDPTPGYFLEDFDMYGIGIVSQEDTMKEYDSFLGHDPKQTKFSLIDLIDDVAIYPEKGPWAIYASRYWEICLIGFTSKEEVEGFVKCLGEDGDIFCSVSQYIQELDDMLQFSKEVKKKYATMLQNYDRK